MHSPRLVKDRVTAFVLRSALFLILALACLVTVVLFVKSQPILARSPLAQIFLSSSWRPMKGQFGFFPFIMGTLEVTAIAMVLSLPCCLLCALYLSEYARKRFREFASLVIDILAGIPSVIYGLWGIVVIVPLVRLTGHFLGVKTTGYSLLTGGVILAIMVCPVIISVCLEVFRSIPLHARESALALGTTKWEMIKCVVLRGGLHGIIAATVLGFARAIGETMAVVMVVGNVPAVPSSLFGPAYPLPALIANNYGEMMSIPLYDSALMLAALILLVVVGVFSLTAHLALLGIERRGG